MGCVIAAGLTWCVLWQLRDPIGHRFGLRFWLPLALVGLIVLGR